MAIIFTVVYSIDGVPNEVIPCEDGDAAELERNQILVNRCYCVEDCGELLADHKKDGTVLYSIGGKHYYVGGNEFIGIYGSRVMLVRDCRIGV